LTRAKGAGRHGKETRDIQERRSDAMSRLSQLAINEEGFVFDPSSGESYTANQSGLMILKGLKEGLTPKEISKVMAERFEVSPEEAESDAKNFVEFLNAIGVA
jgi:hypothetical protein